MPGVPGRGCDECRRQKKGCDRATPTCSRCARLGLQCVGSGKQRFRFEDRKCPRRRPHSSSSSSTAVIVNSKDAITHQGPAFQACLVYHTPRTGTDIIISAFIDIIKPSATTKQIDCRYNLAWMYGPFLNAIPQRLGRNEALDAASQALIQAHTELCSRLPFSIAALNKYFHAIEKLRLSLDCPSTAHSIETLSAAILLLICQTLNGSDKQHFTSHCIGAVQILSARDYFNWQDDFERNLVLSLRGPLLMYGLLHNLNHSPSLAKWKSTLMKPLSDGDSRFEKLMSCFARARTYIDRGKLIRDRATASAVQPAIKGAGDCMGLLEDVRADYMALVAINSDLHAFLATVKSKIDEDIPIIAADGSIPPYQNLPDIYRMYGFSLTLCCIFNSIFQAVFDLAAEFSTPFPSGTATPIRTTTTAMIETQEQGQDFADAALTLSQEVSKFRPLGASYIYLLLCAAWCCCSRDSPSTLSRRLAIETVIDDYLWDFLRRKRVEGPLDPMILSLASNLRF